MTAREFLEWAGYEVNRKTLYALTLYLESDIDFSQFPDAHVTTDDGTPLHECVQEPVRFQAWMDRLGCNKRKLVTGQPGAGKSPAQNQGKEEKNDDVRCLWQTD